MSSDYPSRLSIADDKPVSGSSLSSARQQTANESDTLAQSQEGPVNSRSLWSTIPVLLVISAGAAFGQTFGEITGRVSDSSGAAVAAAAITAINANTNAARQTAASATGD